MLNIKTVKGLKNRSFPNITLSSLQCMFLCRENYIQLYFVRKFLLKAHMLEVMGDWGSVVE